MGKKRNQQNKRNTTENEQVTEVEVPKGFIKKQKRGLNTFQYGNYNGREYKVLKNGCGMWADSGKVFKLSDLD